MTDNDKKILEADTEGLVNYEYLANNIGQSDDDLDFIIENLRRIDIAGQYLASAARYLHASTRKPMPSPSGEWWP